MTTIRENRLFLGNPGTGKSTLINCLLGANHMKSGLSWGGGLTQGFQRYEKDGIVYMDTPGLADKTIEAQAAQAITRALKQSGTYKLFFMVRLQNGRVVSEDLVTLERVLDSIDAGDLNYKYTVVMNCLGPREYNTLITRGEEFKKIKTLINHKYLTESFCLVPRIAALVDMSNQVVELPYEIRAFLDHEAPTITVEQRQVSPIDVSDFASEAATLKSELERLRSDHAALLATLREQERRHDEAMAKMQRELHRKPSNAPESPRSDPNYRVIPLTPNANGSSPWCSRQKCLVAVVVVVIVVLAVAVGVVVVATQSKSTPTPTSSTPTPTPTTTNTREATTVPPPAPTTPASSLKYKPAGCMLFPQNPSGSRTSNTTVASDIDAGYRFAVASNTKYFFFRGDRLVVAFNASLQESTVDRVCVGSELYVWKVVPST